MHDCAFPQPSVIGELLAGVILGKTVLNNVYPEGWSYLFSSANKASTALAAVSSLCVTLYLLVAGIEMNLKQVFARGVSALGISIPGILFPFGIGFICAYYAPEYFGRGTTDSLVVYSLFVGCTLCITALPVAAKTLRDLNLYKTDMGQTIMAGASICDLVGWIFFSVILALANASFDNGLGKQT